MDFPSPKSPDVRRRGLGTPSPLPGAPLPLGTPDAGSCNLSDNVNSEGNLPRVYDILRYFKLLCFRTNVI